MDQQLLSCSRIAFSFSIQTPSPPLQHRHPFQASSHVDILRSMRLHLRDAFPELAQPRTATCKPLASIPFRGPSHLLLPPRDASQKQLAAGVACLSGIWVVLQYVLVTALPLLVSGRDPGDPGRLLVAEKLLA